MDVRSVMTPEPACCTPQTKLTDVAKMMLDNDCGEIPVVADKQAKKPVGVITDRDIVVRTLACGTDPTQKAAGDCMTSPPIVVTPDMSLVECCDIMEREQIRRVPVVDTDGRLVGIVALADIAMNAGRRTTAEVIKEVSEPTKGDARH